MADANKKGMGSFLKALFSKKPLGDYRADPKDKMGLGKTSGQQSDAKKDAIDELQKELGDNNGDDDAKK